MTEEVIGSGYKVPLTKILEINPHPNADRLELAKVYGFEVVVKKDTYKVGDEVIYIPIDSVLPKNLEDHLFPEDSKIKLHKHRVRQIRIRKAVSQGMLVDKSNILEAYHFLGEFVLERDYAKEFKIAKYEPPVKGRNLGVPTQKIKRLENGNFRKYNGLNNVKWFPTLFKPGEEVVVTEKIHGTNARAGILPWQANTFFRKVLKFFRLAPKWENCYGSNNVQLQDRRKYKGYYGEDVYGRTFQEYDTFSKLKPGEQIFGEIYGHGLQKNYTYGCKEGEYKFVLFDVIKDGEYLDPDEVKSYAWNRGFDYVPELYRGPYDYEKIKAMTLGDSVLAPSQKVREGVVVRPLKGVSTGMGSKKILKFISEKYLDKDQDEFH